MFHYGKRAARNVPRAAQNALFARCVWSPVPLPSTRTRLSFTHTHVRFARRYIRIDGRTLPKQRQEYISRFQNDPTTKIALLSITAAGVAVTLTAASRVLFAELFWTPAMLMQAEDRCHRIGQLATVKAKYLIARNTLDDVLWQLADQKIRSLGEFVEGKTGAMFEVDEDADGIGGGSAVYAWDKEAGGAGGAGGGGDDEGGAIAAASKLQTDFADLGAEEMAKIKNDDDDDDEEVSGGRGWKDGSVMIYKVGSGDSNTTGRIGNQRQY